MPHTAHTTHTNTPYSPSQIYTTHTHTQHTHHTHTTHTHKYIPHMYTHNAHICTISTNTHKHVQTYTTHTVYTFHTQHTTYTLYPYHTHTIPYTPHHNYIHTTQRHTHSTDTHHTYTHPHHITHTVMAQSPHLPPSFSLRSSQPPPDWSFPLFLKRMQDAVFKVHVQCWHRGRALQPSVLEAEAGRSQGTPQPRLHSETLFQNKQNTSIIFHPVTLAYLKALKWYCGLSLANHTFSFQHNVMFPVTGSCYITHDGVELPASYLSLLSVGNMGLSQHTLPSLTLKTLS